MQCQRGFQWTLGWLIEGERLQSRPVLQLHPSAGPFPLKLTGKLVQIRSGGLTLVFLLVKERCSTRSPASFPGQGLVWAGEVVQFWLTKCKERSLGGRLSSYIKTQILGRRKPFLFLFYCLEHRYYLWRCSSHLETMRQSMTEKKKLSILKI